MLHRIGLRAKTTGGIVALSAAALILAMVAISAMRSFKAVLDSVIQVDARRVDLAGRIQYASADLLRLENGIIFRLMSQDAAGSRTYQQQAGAALVDLKKQLDLMRPLAGDKTVMPSTPASSSRRRRG